MTAVVALVLLLITAASVVGFYRYRAARPEQRFPDVGWAAAHHAVFVALVTLVVVEASLPESVFGQSSGGIGFRSGLVISGTLISVCLLPLTIAASASVTFVRSRPARLSLIAVVWLITVGLLSLHLQAWLR